MSNVYRAAAFAMTPSSGGQTERLSKLFRRAFDNLIRLLTATDTTLAEFASSTTLIAIGGILAMPSDALTPTVPLFQSMLNVMPEHPHWSACFIGLGIFQAVANLTRSHPARRYAAFCCAAFYGFVGFLGVYVHPISLLGATFKVHSLVQALVYLHLGVGREG